MTTIDNLHEVYSNIGHFAEIRPDSDEEDKENESLINNGSLLKKSKKKTTLQPIEIYEKGEDCLTCLKDIQRFLRRDVRSSTKDVYKILGSWKIVKNHLVPLLRYHHDDKPLAYEVCKLLVLITMPPDSHSEDIPTQIRYLQEHKQALLSSEALTALMGLLAPCLLKCEEGTKGRDEDKWIELILSLYRNLLWIPEAEDTIHDSRARLNDDLVRQCFRTNFFELLAMLCQRIHDSDYSLFIFLLLEIMTLLFKIEKADVLATYTFSAKGETTRPNLDETQSAPSQTIIEPPKKTGLLTNLLKEEKRKKPQSANNTKIGTFIKKNADFESRQITITSDPFKKDSRSSSTQASLIRKKKQEPAARLTDDRTKAILKPFVTRFIEENCFANLLSTAKNTLNKRGDAISPAEQLNCFWLTQYILRFVNYKITHSPEVDYNSIESDFAPLAGCFVFEEFAILNQAIEQLRDEKNFSALQIVLCNLKEMSKSLTLMNRLSVDSEMRLSSTLTQKKIFLDGLFFDTVITLAKDWNSNRSDKSYLRDLVETVDNFLTMMEEYEKREPIHRQVIRRSYAPTSKDQNDTDTPKRKTKKRKQDENKETSLEDEEKDQQEMDMDDIEKEAKRIVEQKLQEIEDEIQKEIAEQEKEKEGKTEKDSQQEENDSEFEEAEDQFDEQYQLKVVTLADYAERFASHLIIANWCQLLQEYQTLETYLIDSIASLFEKILSSFFQPMLFQVSVLHLFHRILNDPISNTSRFQRLVTVIKTTVRDFLTSLQKNRDLLASGFIWKTKTDCQLLTTHPIIKKQRKKKEKEPIEKEEKEEEKEEAEEEPEYRYEPETYEDVEWQEDEDQLICDQFEKYHEMEHCLELISVAFPESQKSKAGAIYHRLKVLDKLPEGFPEPEPVYIRRRVVKEKSKNKKHKHKRKKEKKEKKRKKEKKEKKRKHKKKKASDSIVTDSEDDLPLEFIQSEASKTRKAKQKEETKRLQDLAEQEETPLTRFQKKRKVENIHFEEAVSEQEDEEETQEYGQRRRLRKAVQLEETPEEEILIEEETEQTQLHPKQPQEDELEFSFDEEDE